MIYEVQVVSWSNGHGSPASFNKPGVGLMESLMDINEGIDDGLSVCWGWGHIRKNSRKVVRTDIL